MWNDIVLYLCIWILAGLFVAVYYSSFKRRLHGKIQLKLTKKIYNYWDDIEWSFTLHTKRDIAWKDLKVYLTAHQRQSRYTPTGAKNTRQVEFARIVQDVEWGVNYNAGQRKNYKINIKIPELDDLFSEENLPKPGKGKLKKLARHTLIRSKRHNYSWEVRVKLQGESVKLSSSRYIFVSEAV